MNATATLALAAPPARGRAGLSAGWGISLLVHALVAAWLLHASWPRAPAPGPAARIEVRLARPAHVTVPSPAPAVAPEPAKTKAPGAPARAAAEPTPARPAPARRAPAARAPSAPAPAPAYETRPAPAHETPDTNEQTIPAQAGSQAGDAAASASPPAVDIASARRAARLIARESGKATVALPARKTVVDPNADRQVIDPIEAARKPDCKSAYAGAGILGLIPLAASAVIDTGCKW